MLEFLANLATDFWDVLAQMSPYLLFGFLTAGLLSVFLSPAFVERHLGGRGFWPVLKASALGVPLPLCSCGVIPVSASLRRHGAGRGAVTAFLISTPQTGVDSILVTYSLMGWVFALFRPVVALLSGLIGGMAVSAFDRDGQAPAASACNAECCADPDRRGRFRRALVYGFVTLPRDIARPLLIGLVVAALISALIPKDYFAPYLGGGVGAILALMLLGIPVYVCATASVPIAANLILVAGVSPGAALAFLMTGPATNAAAIATIWKIMGRRTALLYLATVALTALGAGLALDQLVTRQNILAHHAHEMLPGWFQAACAVALLGVLAAAIFRPERRGEKHEHPADSAGGSALRLKVAGMTCGHCADAVRRALAGSTGVSEAEVDLAAGMAEVRGAGLSPDALLRAVRDLGYGAELAPANSPQPRNPESEKPE